MVEGSIRKQVTLRAPVSRVWQALTDAAEFSSWFGVKLNGPFVAGQPVTGNFEGEMNEAAITEFQKSRGIEPSKVKMPPENSVFCTVERMEPERYFSFRWIPYGVDAEADLDNEPTTLVEFSLETVPGGTQLTITESGFERVPAHRRQRALLMNDGGWEAQAQNIRKYVDGD